MREMRTDGAEVVNQEVRSISREEVRPGMRRMKPGKAVGPDNILMEV